MSETLLSTNGYGRLISTPAVAPRTERRLGMPGRMKAFLVLLGALGFAAMNGSLPWGP
jgi:hypothetical protein